LRSIGVGKKSKQVVFMAGDRKASFHQFGTATMPARPVIFISKHDRNVLRSNLKRNIEAAL